MESKGTKGRVLALLRYLQLFTDEKHPASTQKIIDDLQKQGYKVNRKTLRDDIDLLIEDGVDIIVEKSISNNFFIGERHFEMPELKLLIDAVSSSHFISAQKSEILIEKLSAFASEHQRQQLAPRIYATDRIKPNNTGAYYVLDQITEAIQDKKQVRFQYTDYDADKNIILRHDGIFYEVSPYACLWNDDFYYLVAYSEDKGKVITFRIDRIVNLDVSEVESVPEPDDFEIQDFASKVFEMYDGREQEVELICDNVLMKSVIDQFGENIQTERISEEQFKATVKVSTSRTFYAWVFRFMGAMKIAGPDNVKQEYRNMAMKILED